MMPRMPPMAPCQNEMKCCSVHSVTRDCKGNLVTTIAKETRDCKRKGNLHVEKSDDNPQKGNHHARAIFHDFRQRTNIVVTNPQMRQNQLGMQWICTDRRLHVSITDQCSAACPSMHMHEVTRIRQ